jgi:Na+-transporting methylmalonyl-CoA/oxaloacetate decarboxylase gamma subunit
MVTDASFSGRLLLVLVLVVVCISAVVSDDVRKVRNAMRRREGMVRTKKIKQKVRRGNGRVGRLTVVILGCGRNRSLVSTVSPSRIFCFFRRRALLSLALALAIGVAVVSLLLSSQYGIYKTVPL